MGTAMCEALAELGANIVIGSRDQEKGNVIANRLSAEYDVKASGVSLDITDPESLDSALQFIEKEFGQLDVLINNAWSGKRIALNPSVSRTGNTTLMCA